MCQDVKTIVPKYTLRGKTEEEEESLLHLLESQRMFPGVNHEKKPSKSLFEPLLKPHLKKKKVVQCPSWLCTKAIEVTLF